MPHADVPTRLTFEQATALEPLDSPTFGATVDPGWGIGGRPNGGYLLSILCRAATAVVPHDHVLAAGAHYLRSPGHGPVQIETEVLRTGRSASQVRARLSQDGAACVEALVTVGRIDGATTPDWDRGVPAYGSPPAPEEAVRLHGPTPTGIPVELLEQVDLRLDPDCTGFAVGSPSGNGELRGWLALPDGAAFDPVSLVFAADSFPPATFEIAPSGWVPTLELTVYVRALPSPGPVRILHRAGMIEGERVDESCVIWDSTGRLVAHSTQLAGIRFG